MGRNLLRGAEREGFWCQHPYKGTFGPVTVRIP